MQQMSKVLALPSGTQTPLLETEERTDRVVWFIVFAFILLALGATIILGALVWCFIHAYNYLYAVFSINPWQFQIGCG
jgi:hypothetical protein